jgi:hypothetical protein
VKAKDIPGAIAVLQCVLYLRDVGGIVAHQDDLGHVHRAKGGQSRRRHRCRGKNGDLQMGASRFRKSGDSPEEWGRGIAIVDDGQNALEHDRFSLERAMTAKCAAGLP